MRLRRGLILVVCLLAIAVGTSLASGPRPASATPLTGIAAISAGGYHTCARTKGGGVKCWGRNGDGQLGNGTTIDSSTPVDVSGLTSGVAAISSGNDYTCALTAAGAVKCWGRNDLGQLGNGTSSGPETCQHFNHACSSTPVDVSGLTSAVAAVAAGWFGHTCAVTTAGAVKCWGLNFSGQLGSGTNTKNGCACISTPVDVTGLTSGVLAISVGALHSCALTTAGGVKCWGRNLDGQLGNGTTIDSSTPIDVSGLPNGVAAISSGSLNTCALTTAGGVKCWGDDTFGQLEARGDAETCIGGEPHSCSTTPLDMAGLTSGVAGIAVGLGHACAIMTTGSLKCWGDDLYGQVGNGTATTTAPPCLCVPTPIDVLNSGVAAASAGGVHTCALTTAGDVKCWGNNYSGQLGDGTTTNQQTPVDVVDLPLYPVGDVNCDSTINAIDPALVLQLITARLRHQLPCQQNADVNHDGSIRATDATLILQYSAGLIHQFT